MKSFKYIINGNVYKVNINRIEDITADVEVNGTPYRVKMDKPTKKQVITINRPVQTISPPVVGIRQQNVVTTSLDSPLPGIIIDVSCKVGDIVKKGQKLLILEAMKMENSISADKDGVVKEIKVNKGDSVLEGTNLVIIESI